MRHTPVLAGAAAIQQRSSDVTNSREPVALMIDAVRAAAADCGNAAILEQVQRIYVPKGLWQYSDPARLIAQAIGAATATTVLAEIGILQQTLIGDACERIARGDIDCAIIVGGEAKYRQLQASIQQIPANEIPQETAADEIMRPEAELWLNAEAQAGLLMPVGFYAIIESALRFARGESVEANRDRIANRYQRFSEIAAQNPHAWKREVIPADTIRNAIGKNRMLAFPYTKAHNSEWSVDQAAALILCSETLADQLGITAEKRVYPLASSESNHMLCLSQRAQLHRSPGATLALQAALSHAGLSTHELSLLELYSCFPSAVQICADALGIDDTQDVTVMGGMAAAGGPLNNYVFQATCRMVELLRQQKNATGLISSVSGMFTKQAYGVWSTQKPSTDFAWLDVSEAVAAASQACDVIEGHHGPARIVGYTVLYQGDTPSRAIIIADTADNQRTLAFSEDATLMQQMMSDEWCGRSVMINGNTFCAS